MDKNWVKIYATSDVYKAELLKGLLIENEISAVVINKKDSAYLIGEAELYVLAENVIIAKRLINKHEGI
ncbi:MAG: putative signal transducing protein [Bacteroidales bacterium]